LLKKGKLRGTSLARKQTGKARQRFWTNERERYVLEVNNRWRNEDLCSLVKNDLGKVSRRLKGASTTGTSMSGKKIETKHRRKRI